MPSFLDLFERENEDDYDKNWIGFLVPNSNERT